MANKICDSSYHKLKWNVKGIFDNIPVIEKALDNWSNQLPDHLREKKKITYWIGQIRKINETIYTIKKSKIAELERNINYTFAEPDLVVLSFVRPSMRNMFEELRVDSSRLGLDVDFESYLKMDEAAKVLALIGDAAINLALVQILWQPNISNVGELTAKRSEYASNEHLSKMCDKWDLYGFRIHRDMDQSENDHAKGTIIEALFGVVYVEAGLDQVLLSIDSLK
ncbi:MAG TPA: ribonuclease III domain-containing protein [Candidatus Methanoperedens sp.]